MGGQSIMRNVRQFVMFFSLIVIATGHTLAALPKARCNSNFTACQIPENVLLALPFAAISGDVIIQEPNSTNVSDVFRILNNLVDTGGGTGLGNLVILYSADDNVPLPDPSSYSANAVVIKEVASGATSYFGNGTTYTLDTGVAATKLTYTGDTTADYHDPVQLRAVLTVLATGAAIPNATVDFTVGSQNCNGTTSASGVASCSVVLTQAAGNFTLTASFSGIFGADAATSNSLPFVITKEETTLSYTGDTVIANGGTAHLSGVLLEDNVTPIAGRAVTFTLGAGGVQTCTGTTDASGKAACTINPAKQSLGPVLVSDSFAGDAFYRPASASTNAIVFAFLVSGSFIIGDQNAQVGTQDMFWGAQWTANNVLSAGAPPNSFKGFAETISMEPPACGVTWMSRPGNSSNPPTSVPAYMGVLVSPSVNQSGAAVSGSGTRIVVIKTDPGYGPDPSQPGTGTVVAQFCP
jgi:hypothetical protein